MAGTGARSLSVVVPVYNSEASLPELVDRLKATLTGMGADHEIILVDDCSRDGSWAAIGTLAQDSTVHGVALTRNYGQHNALLCGIRMATKDVVITIDDDLQNPPEEIPNLLAALGPGVDVVYGVPRTRQHGLLRNVASQVTKLVLKHSMGVTSAPDVSAFRAFNRPISAAFSSFGGAYVSIDVLLTWGTTRFSAISVDHHERVSGRSNYTISKLMSHALNMATGFSTLPLRFASLVGFVFTLFGIVLFVYVIVRLIVNGGSVPGFPFLASTIAILGGAQLFALGIIGEYLARVFVRTMDRPTYLVRELTTLAK